MVPLDPMSPPEAGRRVAADAHLTALVRGPEYRLMARPGQREDRRRRAALAGDTMPSPITSTAGA